jgi:hypothetical protein
VNASTDRHHWERCTPRNPCHYCERSDERCSVRDDGKRATCYRVNDGTAVEEKRDSNGSIFYLYRLGADDNGDGHDHENNGQAEPKRKAKAPPPERADPDTLHAVYSALLDHPKLAPSPEHRADLARRGFPEGEAGRRGYRSMPAKWREEIAYDLAKRFGQAALLGVPGFFVNNRGAPSIASLPGLLVPVRDVQGRILGLLVRPDERLDDGAKYLWVSSAKRNGPGPGAPAHVPMGAAGPASVIRLTEGALKADLATVRSGVPTIGASGVTNWRPGLDAAGALGARTVRLAFDADARTNDRVARALLDCAKAIGARGIALEAERWDGAAAKGIDDALVAGIPIEVLAGDDAMVAVREAAKAAGVVDRPEIVCGSETPDEGLKKWTPKALDALAQANRPDPTIFQRGGALVRIVRMAEDAHPVIMAMDLHALRGQLDRAASWGVECFTKKGIRIKWGPPLLDVVRDIMALPCYDPTAFPYLEAIVAAPRFLPDGALLTTPGYNRGSRLFYAPRPDLADLDIPERPTDPEVEAALALIFDELLVDFPFANQASKANALVSMLLSFVRPMIDGPTPLHMFEASTEGTGKGKLADACALPAIGREPHATPQKEDEAEWRKAITTALLLGHQVIVFDNMYMPKGWDDIPYPVDSPVLSAALTLRRWTDRILGGNTEVDLPINCVWMGTGNNVEFSRELARRVVPIRLDAGRERPWERTDFKHELPEWAIANRRELVVACIILIRRWISEGMPAGSERLGSYEAYSRTMGGILGTIGVEGFLANKVKAAASDPESPRWGALCRAWWRERRDRLTATGDVWELITRYPELHEAFADILGDGQPLSQKKKLGKALARHVDRVWSHLKIKRPDATSPTGNAVYKLVPTDDFRENDPGPADPDTSEYDDDRVPF